ncbi:hypothetical protein DLM_2452 [Aquitalea magnusonii]|uniref:Uncharacterized protein n=1 Tax=Aquitalea magnusonii TaxID=332411 RepID=A0A3G9GHF7_9NEIS|nr:hypothetical protein DLM_2452 [Aquitalea magnusonii]
MANLCSFAFFLGSASKWLTAKDFFYLFSTYPQSYPLIAVDNCGPLQGRGHGQLATTLDR